MNRTFRLNSKPMWLHGYEAAPLYGNPRLKRALAEVRTLDFLKTRDGVGATQFKAVQNKTSTEKSLQAEVRANALETEANHMLGMEERTQTALSHAATKILNMRKK